MSTLLEFMTQERVRLGKARADAQAKLAQAQQEIADIDRHLEAIDDYFKKVGTGKKTTTERRPREKGKRAEVLNAVAQSPEGMTRADVLQAFNATDKPQIQSVSNALAALKKSGQLIQEGKLYRASGA